MVDTFSFICGSIFTLFTFKSAKVIYKIYPYLLPNNFFKLNKLNTKKIAIISGSTDGLGKSFANKLHKNNYSLILLGRSS